MMSQWTSLATSIPIVRSYWVMEQKGSVHYVIPTKSSAQNRIPITRSPAGHNMA